MHTDEDNFCRICGSSLVWEECPDCYGEGGHDLYEEDPNWYDPGEWEACPYCKGKGGFLICCHDATHPQEKDHD